MCLGYKRYTVLLVVLALGLGACEVEQVQPQGPRAPVCAAGQIDGEVVLVSRPNLIVPSVIERFEQRYAVDVTEHIYETDKDLLSRITAGADDYDLVLAPDYLTETLRRGGQLFPLDPIALPGRANLDPKFDRRPDEAGDFYSVPFLWGTVGIGLNLNMVGHDTEPSWGLLFDTNQAWTYAGRVSMLEEGRQVLAAAMLYLGYSPNLADRTQVQKAAAIAAEARVHLRGFDSENYAAWLAEGALDVAHGRSDLFLETLPAPSTDFRYAIPKEGAVAWVDTLAVPITARNPCSAHSFIDFILEPEVSAMVANHTRSATPNLEAIPEVLPELLSNPTIYPPNETRDQIHILDYSEELNRLYAEEFIPVQP